MPEHPLDSGPRPEQPFLHDLACLLAAPMQAWTAADGSIASDPGAQGVYVGDTRIVRELGLRADGWTVSHLSTDDSAPRCLVLRAVLRKGGAVIDPEIVVVRERAMTGDRLSEAITVHNASRRGVTVPISVRLVPDATPMDAVKSGGTRRGDPRGTDAGWSTEDERVSVRLSTDGAVARSGSALELAWSLSVPPGGSAGGSWTLDAADAGAVVAAPKTRDLASTADRVVVPAGREFDLGRLLRRSFDDLEGLQLALPGRPDASFVAAGAPWFLTLFGRDSIVAARLLLPVAPEIARGTLAALAHLQGMTDDRASAEAPGRIVHELRRDATQHVGGDERLVLPPRYYGTVDATPLWISLLHDAWRAGLPPSEVDALAPNLEAAVAWLRSTVAADPRGFLSYHDPSGTGLANQGWKDSGDAIRWADGSMAKGPIALCEVQGYAVRAARQAADLLDALGREGAAPLRTWADELTDRFRAAFWVNDGATGARYPALALDADGRAVDGMASNMGHLLGTGILDADEQRTVVGHLMDPVLFSGFGIRTLSTTNAGYWPMRYHAGTVWPHDTALIIDGMLAEGFPTRRGPWPRGCSPRARPSTGDCPSCSRACRATSHRAPSPTLPPAARRHGPRPRPSSSPAPSGATCRIAPEHCSLVARAGAGRLPGSGRSCLSPQRGVARIGLDLRPLHAVEDQFEPELESGAVLGASLDELAGHPREVRVLVGGQLLEHGLADLGLLPAAAVRQARLLQREPVDVAVEEAVGVGGHGDREAGLEQNAEHPLVVAQRDGTRASLRLDQADRPAVPREDLTGRDRPLPHRRLPVGRAHRHLDLGDDEIDESVEEIFLFSTCRYSDIACTPSRRPMACMVSDSSPPSSARTSAARSTRSLLSVPLRLRLARAGVGMRSLFDSGVDGVASRMVAYGLSVCNKHMG